MENCGVSKIISFEKYSLFFEWQEYVDTEFFKKFLSKDSLRIYDIFLRQDYIIRSRMVCLFLTTFLMDDNFNILVGCYVSWQELPVDNCTQLIQRIT